MTLTRKTGEPLGIRINGGVEGKRVNPDDPEDDGIFVTEVCFLIKSIGFDNFYEFQVKDGSPASGILTVGTRILEVSQFSKNSSPHRPVKFHGAIMICLLPHSFYRFSVKSTFGTGDLVISLEFRFSLSVLFC